MKNNEPGAGKRWITFGDSITWQDGQPYGGKGPAAKGYQTIVQEKFSFSEIVNKGVSGRPMANGTVNGPGTNTTAKEFGAAGFDLVTVAAGTNDFRLNVPIGNLHKEGEYDTETFYGAYQDMLEFLLSQNTSAQFVLLTPLQRDSSGYDIHFRNGAGCLLIDYVDAIKAIGNHYSIPVCDLYSDSGITPQNLHMYTLEGLHPNDLGYERMGRSLLSFLKKIFI